MHTVIYLSNSNIQIAVGDAGKKRVSVQKLHSIDIAEGSLLNGVIISESNLSKELSEIFQRLNLPRKGIHLIIDSTQFFTKVMSIPKLNEKSTHMLIRKEFEEIENQANYLFDYRVIGPSDAKGMVEVITAAVERDYIKGYIEFFEEMGIGIASIDISLNGMLKVHERIPQTRNMSFISMFLDGSNLISSLFVNGRFKYSNRARVFSEHGTDDFGVEVAKTLSSIMQFHAAEKSEYVLEGAFLCGFTEADYKVSISACAELDLTVGITQENSEFQMPDKEHVVVQQSMASGTGMLADYIFAVGGLIVGAKDIDFYRRCGQLSKKPDKGFGWKKLLPAICVLAICVIASAVLLGINMREKSKLSQINQYVKSKQTVEQYEEAKSLADQAALQQANTQSGELMWNVITSYPKANAKIQSAVQSCAAGKVSITIDDYDAQTGIYQFTAMAAQVTDIYEFINQLEGTKLFANLEYSGYNFTEEQLQYNIRVSGYLSEGAGK